MKQMYLWGGVLLVAMAMCSSCDQAAPGTAAPDVYPDVYAVGYYINGDGNEVACYWKNGIRTDLQESTNASSEARAEAIAISDGDIYIASYHLDNGGSWHANYWKNGSRESIGVATSPDELAAYDIFVDAGDVYVAGYFYDDDAAAGAGEWSAQYWKNDEAAEVLTTTSDINYSKALGIQVADDKVYVAGIDAGHAAYWIDGGKTDLTSGNISRAEAIYVRDTGSVYTTGKYADGAPVACFWIDNFKSEYVAGMISDTSGTDIEVNGSGDIFVSGYEKYSGGENNAIYWKNHTRTELHTSSDARAESIFLLNSDVYVGGWQNNGTNESACYWKNGVRTDLHTTSESKVFDIAVMP